MDQTRHRRILAIVFFIHGGLHFLMAAFGWLIILALISQGYSDQLKTIILAGATLSTVVMPVVSGYLLLADRRWSRGVVYLTCLLILIVSLTVLGQVFSIRLSTTRIIFGVLYGGANLAICIYSVWFMTRRQPNRARRRHLV